MHEYLLLYFLFLGAVLVGIVYALLFGHLHQSGPVGNLDALQSSNSLLSPCESFLFVHISELPPNCPFLKNRFFPSFHSSAVGTTLSAKCVGFHTYSSVIVPWSWGVTRFM